MSEINLVGLKLLILLYCIAVEDKSLPRRPAGKLLKTWSINSYFYLHKKETESPHLDLFKILATLM